MVRSLARVLLVLACVFSCSLASAQTVFLRGDVNDDGRVSIADAHYLALWLSRSGPPPPCIKAADATDDGSVNRGGNVSDVQSIFFDSNCDGRQDGDCANRYTSVAEPRSVPGEDPTPDDLACDSYTGTRPPVADPGARMEILEATCPGGENALAVLKVRISHSRAIGGYSGVIDGFGLFAEPLDRPLDVDGFEWGPDRHAVVRDGVVSFSVLGGSVLEPGWPDTLVRYIWPAAEELVVLKIYLRLEPGTPAGTYPMVLLQAEMADSLTGQAIIPAVTDGTLTVESDVAFDATADLNAGGQWECEARETLPPTGPEDVQVAFHMGFAVAKQGSLATVPLWVEANVPIEGFSFALYYDNSTLRLERVLPLEEGGRRWDLFDHQVIRRDPAVLGDDVIGQAIFSRNDPSAFLSPGMLHQVLLFEFRLDPGAEDGFVNLQLTSLNANPEIPDRTGWDTAVRAFGRLLAASEVTCFEAHRFPRGSGIFIGELKETPFLRGDANADGALSLADAVLVGYSTTRGNDLFPCQDAGDANDNGNVELTDALHIFRHLFDPTPPASDIPAPFPEAGLDGTVDPLPCEAYAVVPSAVTADSIRLGSIEVAPGELVEVPIYVTTTFPLQSYQLVVRFDPQVWVPALDHVNLDGSAFEGLFRRLGVNQVTAALSPDHVTAAFASDLLGLSPAPAGRDLLAGKIAGLVLNQIPPGTEILLEPVLVREGDPPRPDRHRTEVVEVEDGRLVTRIPNLEPAVLRVVDGSEATFHRGDSNFDLRVDLADAVFTLNHLFRGGTAPSCEDAADADDSGKVELTDAVLTLNHLFGTGPGELAYPHLARGRDALPDGLAPCREPQ